MISSFSRVTLDQKGVENCLHNNFIKISVFTVNTFSYCSLSNRPAVTLWMHRGLFDGKRWYERRILKTVTLPPFLFPTVSCYAGLCVCGAGSETKAAPRVFRLVEEESVFLLRET